MIYNMKLNEEPFTKIKEGSKKVEMRLFDEKRHQLKIGDYIVFSNRLSNEELKTKIKDIKIFSSFENLYNSFDKIELGYQRGQEANPSDMDQYYTKEEQQKYGVVAIIIERV